MDRFYFWICYETDRNALPLLLNELELILVQNWQIGYRKEHFLGTFTVLLSAVSRMKIFLKQCPIVCNKNKKISIVLILEIICSPENRSNTMYIHFLYLIKTGRKKKAYLNQNEFNTMIVRNWILWESFISVFFYYQY